MSVLIRIGLYIFAGWLYGRGLIGDELRQTIGMDPASVESVEVLLSALVAAVPVIWWRLAKRFGWNT